MTANNKVNFDLSLDIAFVDGIRAFVSISQMPVFDFPVVCVSRLF